MKKMFVIALMAMVLVTALCGTVIASAPNSGDCIPDGSGWDDETPRPGLLNGKGPAPNSGDGIPDGSGF